MDFSVADLRELSEVVSSAWLAGVDRDWSAPAGSLEWSCSKTAEHAIDTVFAPAFFLASQKLDGYPEGGRLTVSEGATPESFVEWLRIATVVHGAVVEASGPDDRAVIWRRPRLEVRPPRDFPPRAGVELILHAHDICSGLGVAFNPSVELCGRLREHTREWPMWNASQSGWTPLGNRDDPWTDLLQSSGRTR